MELPDEKVFCPQTAFKKRCRDMVVKCNCPLWIEVLGNHPQTNETVHRSVCAIAITPLLLIQGNQMQGQTTASVDKVATEVKKHRDENVALGAIAINQAKHVLQEVLESGTQQIAAPSRQMLIGRPNVADAS